MLSSMVSLLPIGLELLAILTTVSCNVLLKTQTIVEPVANPIIWQPSATPTPSAQIQTRNQRKNLMRTDAVHKIHYLADKVEKERDDAHLYCKMDGAEGREQMTWKKEGETKPFKEGRQPFDSRISVRKGGHGVIELTIADLKPDDTGDYTCSFKLESGKTFWQTGTLIVEYMSRFSSRQSMLMKYHSLGGSTTIGCQATGQPLPSYKWYKDGRQITNNSTFNIDNKDGKSSLKVVTSAGDDSRWVYGTYSCNASNKYGSSVMQYKLEAAVIPDKSRNVTIKTARSTYIELGVAQPGDTGGIPITGYRVRWMEVSESSSVAGGGAGGGAAGGGMATGEAAEAEGVATVNFTVGEPIVIPGLDPGKEYIFEIAAMNEVGVGKTIMKTITTPVADDDGVGAVLYPGGGIGLFPLWIFLGILLFFLLLLLLFLLLWCCGWLTSSALICCPCCAKCCPDCVECCSALCWCLPLLGCCVCCGRTYRGTSYDVMKKKKVPLCICCPTDALPIFTGRKNIRLLALQRNEKTEVGANSSAFSTFAKVGAGSIGINSAGGYATKYALENDYKGKTDTMTSRLSETKRNRVFTYDSDSSSSVSGHAVHTMETQTSGNDFTSNSRHISRDHHVSRDVYLERRGKELNTYRLVEPQETIQAYALASDWNQTRGKDRLERSYRDEVDASSRSLKRISKRDERYSSQPMVEHLSRRDSVNRDRKRRSSVEVITFYQPGEQVPATRDAKIQIYTNEDDYGSLPRMKVSQFHHDTRVDADRHLRSSSIPRNIRLSTMVDMGDPTASDYDRQTYSEVRRKKDMTKYATAPVVRRPKRYTTDEATQTLRRSKYDDEFDIPLERLQPSREPSQQRNPDPGQDIGKHHGVHHVRPQQTVQEVIYRPITVETKESSTMGEQTKRWSRPPTPPHAVPSDPTYRAFPIEMELSPQRRTPEKRPPRPPAKPHRSKPRRDVEEPMHQTIRPDVECGKPFDFDVLDRMDSANIQTQTEFSPLDSDSITKESHGRWPEEPVHERHEQWVEVVPVRASPREPYHRARYPEDERPEHTTQVLATTLERGQPYHRPHHGQELVEETVIRRHRSIELLDQPDTAHHQYAVGPEVIFVDSGNYSMETEPVSHHHSSKSETEPEHHLEVSPPETHDFFEETEIIETTKLTEQETTEVKSKETRTETKTQVVEVQSGQSTVQQFVASGSETLPTDAVDVTSSQSGTSMTMSRVAGPQHSSGGQAVAGSHGGADAHSSIWSHPWVNVLDKSAEEQGGGVGGGTMYQGTVSQSEVSRGSAYSQGGGVTGGTTYQGTVSQREASQGSAFSQGGGWSQSGGGSHGGGSQEAAWSVGGGGSHSGGGYSYQAKGAYSVTAPRVTESKTYLTVERAGNRSSPSNAQQRSNWRV